MCCGGTASNSSPAEPVNFVAHPVLRESVTYANPPFYWAFDRRGLSVELSVDGHDDDALFFEFWVPQSDDFSGPPNRYEWLAFETANYMLDRMGWIECPTEGCGWQWMHH